MGARHHVVSQGYMRNFADGPRIRLIDKRTEASKVVGIRDAFVEKGFNALNVDGADVEELEKEWARVEARALPDARRLVSGDRDEAGEYAVRVLMALHWARSYVFREMFEEAFHARFDPAPDEIAAMDHIVKAFAESHGRPPGPGEIERLVRGRAAQIKRENDLLVERTAAIFNKAMDERFTHLHVEIARVVGRRYGLVTSDSPVVLVRQPLRVDMRRTIPLLEADGTFMPLSRWVGAFLTSHPEREKPVYPIGVQQLNALTWRNARARVACHPDEDFVRAIPTAASSRRPSGECS